MVQISLTTIINTSHRKKLLSNFGRFPDVNRILLHCTELRSYQCCAVGNVNKLH